MSLKRIALRDFVIVRELELDLGDGFSVLTGETGAGKSILVDALQLALGARADAGVVREGAARAEISAEFDLPPALAGRWLEEAGFEAGDTLLLRRSIDSQGKSRAWINGSPATATQLREARRAAGRHPRPARLAKPHAAGRGARSCSMPTPACRPRRCSSSGTRLAQRAEGAGRRAPGAGHAAARARTPGLADRRSRQARARRRRVGRAEREPHAPVACAGAARGGRRRARRARGRGRRRHRAADPGARHAAGAGAPGARVPRHRAKCWPPAWRRPKTPRTRCTPTCARPTSIRDRLAELDERMALVAVARAPLQAHARRAAGAAGGLEGRAGAPRCRSGPGGPGSCREARRPGLHGRGPQRCPRRAPRRRRNWPRPSRRRCRAWACRAAASKWRCSRWHSPARTAWTMSRSWWPAIRAHAAAGGQGRLRRRALAHRAGHRRHHQPAGHGPDADLRRGRCRASAAPWPKPWAG